MLLKNSSFVFTSSLSQEPCKTQSLKGKSNTTFSFDFKNLLSLERPILFKNLV